MIPCPWRGRDSLSSPSLWKQDNPFSSDPNLTLTPAGAGSPWGCFPPGRVPVPVPCPALCSQLSLLTPSSPPLHPQLLQSLPRRSWHCPAPLLKTPRCSGGEQSKEEVKEQQQQELSGGEELPDEYFTPLLLEREGARLAVLGGAAQSRGGSAWTCVGTSRVAPVTPWGAVLAQGCVFISCLCLCLCRRQPLCSWGL